MEAITRTFSLLIDKSIEFLERERVELARVCEEELESGAEAIEGEENWLLKLRARGDLFSLILFPFSFFIYFLPYFFLFFIPLVRLSAGGWTLDGLAFCVKQTSDLEIRNSSFKWTYGGGGPSKRPDSVFPGRVKESHAR